MKDQVTIVVLSTLCAVILAEEVKLPDYIKPCHINKPDFNECALENANYAIPYIVKGDRKVGIPPLDPLNLPLIEVEQNDFKLTLTDVVITGLENVKVISMNLDRTSFDAVFHIDRLNLVGKYKVNGKVLVLNLEGEGPTNITGVGGNYTIRSKLTPHEKNGHTHLKFEKPTIDYTLERAYFDLQNLLSGDERLSTEINKVLNENWHEILKDVGAPIKETVSTIIDSIVSKILGKFPESNIFPK